jgi:hypothetical protein
MKKSITLGVLALLLLAARAGKAASSPQPKAGETWALVITTGRQLTPDEWNDLQSSFIINLSNVAGINSQQMSGTTLNISLTYKQNATLAVGQPLPMISPQLPIPSMSGVATTLMSATNITKTV